MAGQQRFWCPKSYNSVHLRKEMYGSKPNGYRTVGKFRFPRAPLYSILIQRKDCREVLKSHKNYLVVYQ